MRLSLTLCRRMVWYVFPVSFFAVRGSMNLFPASRRKRSTFEKYREAWWILRSAVGGTLKEEDAY
jgi:hypothetical protein